MRREWKVTLQGNPPEDIEVATDTSDARTRIIFEEIKQQVRALGHDPRLIIDWESSKD